MDLKQLQYFVVCAQTGSFSDAAKNLYSTQPSVSKVIKGLEDTLGMQLFERLPRGIRLTVQGHKMYEYASKIINEVNVLENTGSCTTYHSGQHISPICICSHRMLKTGGLKCTCQILCIRVIWTEML